jgi:hypothetical protein
MISNLRPEWKGRISIVFENSFNPLSFHVKFGIIHAYDFAEETKGKAKEK